MPPYPSPSPNHTPPNLPPSPNHMSPYSPPLPNHVPTPASPPTFSHIPPHPPFLPSAPPTSSYLTPSPNNHIFNPDNTVPLMPDMRQVLSSFGINHNQLREVNLDCDKWYRTYVCNENIALSTPLSPPSPHISQRIRSLVRHCKLRQLTGSVQKN